MKAVIYRLFIEQVPDKSYIGSTIQFKKRLARHINELSKGIHHSCIMQESYNLVKNPTLQYQILETCEESVRWERELYYITFYGMENLYNLFEGAGTFGDALTHHPKREDIVAKITSSMYKRYATMSEEDRKLLSVNNMGANNPNWRGGVSSPKCACGNTMMPNAKTCSACRNREGGNNPFFGKKHTPETLAKIAAANKGKIPTNSRKVEVDCIVYLSATEASRVLGCTPSTILNRINNKNFVNYKFIE